MVYAITFLEGLITFISPCLLPMLPIYISYLAGGDGEERRNTTVKHALGFILGFTAAFMAMGAFAGTLGTLLRRYQTAVNVVSGLIVVLFGLSFLEVFRFQLFRGSVDTRRLPERMGFFPAVLFGVIFSVGWTPCVGAFLGSALMLASQQGSVLQGVVLLFCYSMGLGVPFLISAVLIQELKGAFGWIKSHYGVINRVCGLLLVAVGILMMTGVLSRVLSLLAV